MDFSNKAAVAKLIDECIRGNKISQQFLYSSFYGKMLVLCKRYAYSDEDAKDILHEGFIKVFQKLKDFKNLGSLEGWIRRIMTNCGLDYIRKRKEFYVFTDNYQLENLLSDAEEKELQKNLEKENAELILSLVNKLTPGYKAVFNLHAIESLTHKEIAEELGISVGTSKSNYAKAKFNVLEYYKEYLNEKRRK